MPTITAKDGTKLYYKDWGEGQPIVFSHGWPLNADAWEDQMMFLASHGYRCVAHDRRGHGRSDQPNTSNHVSLRPATAKSAVLQFTPALPTCIATNGAANNDTALPQPTMRHVTPLFTCTVTTLPPLMNAA